MAYENRTELANKTLDTLCKMLDDSEMKYKKDGMIISFSAEGDDLPVNVTIKVDDEVMLVKLFSHLPLTVPEDKRLDVAIAVNAINYALSDGSFDYDLRTGRLIFRLTNSFMDTELSESVFAYMVFYSFSMVDEYNDKLFMMAKGMLSLDEFLKSLYED
jgi:hypothetical protein